VKGWLWYQVSEEKETKKQRKKCLPCLLMMCN
jgi:hypothetical protein